MITILIYNDFTLAISHPLKRQPQLHTYASIPTWASEKTMCHTRGESCPSSFLILIYIDQSSLLP